MHTLLVAALLTTAPLDGLDWLAGGWRSETSRFTMEEHWTPADGGLMLAVSRTVSGGKAVGFEFLRIEARGDVVVYVAQPNGRPGTEFTSTEITSRRAVFENPEHDHPKVIRYELTDDGGLLVTIDGDEGESRFGFQRIGVP